MFWKYKRNSEINDKREEVRGGGDGGDGDGGRGNWRWRCFRYTCK